MCVELGNKIEGAYKMVKLSSSLVKGMEVVFCIIAEEIVEFIINTIIKVNFKCIIKLSPYT